MVSIDVVEFAIRTHSEAGCHRNDAGPPKRFEKFDIHACEIADEAQRADYFIMLHWLGKEAAGV